METQYFLESNQIFVPVFFFLGYERSKDKDKCPLKDKTGIGQKALVSLRSHLRALWPHLRHLITFFPPRFY